MVSPGCPPSPRLKVPTRSMLSGAAASCARRLAYLSSPSSPHLLGVRVRVRVRGRGLGLVVEAYYGSLPHQASIGPPSPAAGAYLVGVTVRARDTYLVRVRKVRVQVRDRARGDMRRTRCPPCSDSS